MPAIEERKDVCARGEAERAVGREAMLAPRKMYCERLVSGRLQERFGSREKTYHAR